jgi:predicted HTH domain antitoxin
LALFQREKLTLGQASRLAGMSQWQFQQLLGSRGIPVHYGVEDFEADLRTLLLLIDEHLGPLWRRDSE